MGRINKDGTYTDVDGMTCVNRDTQEPDYIYVAEDYIHYTSEIVWKSMGPAVFATPDGIGRFFYDDLETAQEQHGTPVVEVDRAID